MSHFTNVTGYVVFIITSFLADVESADQCLPHSKVLSCFPGVIKSIRSFFLFSNYSSWKTIITNKINKYEENAWNEYAWSHPNLHIARACIENVPPRMFWAIADIYPDLVARRHV